MKSSAELQAIRDESKLDMDVRQELDARKVIVGMGTCGIKAGARDVMAELIKQFKEKNVVHTMLTIEGCVGICDKEPIVEVIETDGKKTTYVSMNPEKVQKLVQDHLLDNKVVSEYTL